MASRNRPTRIRQALPDARIIPRIEFLSRSEADNGTASTDKKVHPDIGDKLCEIALEAYAATLKRTVADYKDMDEPFAVIFASVRALDATNHFVSEKAFETTLPNFRRLVANEGKLSLKSAIAELLDKMPPDGSPPFPQMRELAGDGKWRTKLNPAIVRAALERWVELMDELSGRAGSGRSPMTAEKNFVGALAHYWENELGAKLVNSRAFSTLRPDQRSSHAFEQRGLFANFIREAAKIIPKAYRPRSWDQVIRKTIERKL